VVMALNISRQEVRGIALNIIHDEHEKGHTKLEPGGKAKSIIQRPGQQGGGQLGGRDATVYLPDDSEEAHVAKSRALPIKMARRMRKFDKGPCLEKPPRRRAWLEKKKGRT